MTSDSPTNCPDITAALAQVGESLELIANGITVGLDRGDAYKVAFEYARETARLTLPTLSSILEGLKEREGHIARMHAKAVKRAAEMLRIAAKHCEQYASEEVTHYDEAECDGGCIADDCGEAATELEYQALRLTEIRQPAEPVDVAGLIAKLVKDKVTGVRAMLCCGESYNDAVDGAIAIIRQHFGQQIKEGDHD